MNELYEQIPENLLRAFLTKKMCLFVGAGLSQNLGMPNWNELAKKIIDLTYDYGLIDFEDKETLLKTTLNQKDGQIIAISYCHNLIMNFEEKEYADTKKIRTFYKEIGSIKAAYNQMLIDTFYRHHPFVKEDETYKNNNQFGIKLYKLILQLAKKSLIITTNYDNIIPLNDKNREIIDSCNYTKIKKNSIVYLHGLIDKKHPENQSKITLTRQHYDEKYLIKSEEHLKCLEEIFKNYYVFFLGYSLNDFEILQILSKIRNQMNPNELKDCYFLTTYRDSQKNELKVKTKYFEDNYRIKTLFYNVSINGYDALFDKLEQIYKSIPKDIDLFDIMDELISSKNIKENIHAKTLFEDLLDRAKYKNYFFSKINDNLAFFDVLKDKDFFYYKDTNKDEFYKPMYMMEKLIPYILKLSAEEQDKYFNSYIQITKQNLKYPISQKDRRAWLSIWSLVTKLPLKYLDKELIELLSSNILDFYFRDIIKKVIKEDNIDSQMINLLIKTGLKYEIKMKKHWHSGKKTRTIQPLYKDALSDIPTQDIAKLIKNDHQFVIDVLVSIMSHSCDFSLMNRKKTIWDSEYNEDLYEDKFEMFVLNLVRDCLIEDNNCISTVKDFLYSKYLILNRIAIFIIQKKWKNSLFRELFYSYLNKLLFKKKKNFRSQLHFIKYELNALLEENAEDIIKSNRFNLSKILNKLYSAEEEKYKEYTIYEFLHPFRNIKPYSIRYNELKKKLNYEPQIKPFVSRSGWVAQKAPIEKEEFKSYSLKEQIEYLQKPLEEEKEYFQEENGKEGHFIAISKEGLAKLFEEVILETPGKYINNLNLFIGLPIIYMQSIMEALTKTVDKEQTFKLDWKKILSFIKKININLDIEQSDWLLKLECSFINIMTKKIKDEVTYDKAIEVLKPILDIPVDKITIKKAMDYGFYNLISGKASEALFFLMNNRPSLNKKLIELFVEQFNKKNNLAFYEAFGSYIDNLYYTFKKNNKLKIFIDLVENIKNKTVDEQIMFLNGYLFGSIYFIDDIFNVFEKSTLFESIFINEHLDYEKKRKFVDLAIYASFFEGRPYLLDKILATNDSVILRMLLSVFGRRENLKPYKTKIIEIWKNLQVFKKLPKDLTDDDKALLGKTFDLLKYLDDSDVKDEDLLNKLLISFDYQPEHNQYFMFKKIDEKINNAPALLNLVLEGYINSQNSIDSYEEKEAVNLLKKVYDWNKEEAIKLADICIDKKNALNDILEWRRTLKI